MKCDRCGCENLPHAKFCRGCGTKIEVAPPPRPTTTVPLAPLHPPLSCSACGTVIKPGKSFCSACGARVEKTTATGHAPLPQAVECSACGFECKPESKFCPACGRPLGIPTQKVEPQDAIQDTALPKPELQRSAPPSAHPASSAALNKGLESMSPGEPAVERETESKTNHVTQTPRPADGQLSSPATSNQDFPHTAKAAAKTSAAFLSEGTKRTAAEIPAILPPQKRQEVPVAPSSSPVAPKRPLLQTRWVWVIAVTVAAGCIALILFRSSPNAVPASASILVDNFTADEALNPGLWVINGPVGSVVGPNLTSPVSTLVQPTLTFSSESGLGVGGLSEKGQAATIETAASFDPPFTVNANVMPTDRDESGFGLIVSDGSGQKGVGITGHLDSAAGPAEIDYITPQAGAGWKSQGFLGRSLRANTRYTLSLFLDAQGSATLKVLAGSQTVGETTVQTGKGPFHIILVEEGGDRTASTHGQVSWRSIKAFSGTMTLPVQTEEHPKPAATNSRSENTIHPPPVALQPSIIQDAVIRPGRTSLMLPPGRSIYLYGMVTGGALPSSGFARGQYAQVADAGGEVAVALAATPDNTNSHTTPTGYYVIGGAAASGFSHYAASYASNGASGASSASDTFTLSQKSLAVMIGLASSQQSIRLTGVPGLKTDALSSGPGASLGIIVHAYFPPGVYTVTEHSAALAGGQGPNHMANLIGVFEPKD